MTRRRTWGLGLAAVALLGASAYSAGLFQGLPIVGGAAYCVSTNQPGGPGTPTTCTNTAPAGPTGLTGNELIPADTQLPNGQNPQSVYIPVDVFSRIGQGSSRNALIGGDFATNLWQRGTTFTSLTPTTTAMTADRWGVYSSGNTVTITKQTGASDIVTSAGLLASMRINRPSGTNTTAICVGQVLPAKDAARFLGNNAVFSFYGLSGSGFLTTNKQITATIAVYTAADSATPGTNTDAFMKGTIANYTAITAASTLTPTATFASNVATIPLSTTWTRYAVSGTVPQLVAATQVTGIGVTICATYPASTGVAGDWFEIAGAQLEATGTNTTAPGSFARRIPADEAVLQQSYSYVLTEGAASISQSPSGQGASTTTCVLSIPTPTTMRMAPTFAAAGTALGATTWTVTHVVTNSALSTPFLAATTGGHTPNMLNMTATTGAVLTAGQTCTLTGAGGGSLLVFSAEP